MMVRDIRQTALYREAEALYTALRRPGTGQISDVVELHASPDGRHAMFAGTLLDKLEGAPTTRICRVDLRSGDTRVMTFGPSNDRLPRYSPDGKQVAFLSDRHRAGDFQLYMLDPDTGTIRRTPHVEGWVESLQWSSDGTKILLAVAGHGADVAGGQGAVTSKKVAEALPSWMPSVETGDETYRWRSIWLHDVASGSVRRVTSAGLNVWEAAWCGADRLAVVASPGPGEGLWYSARLHLIDITSGESREIYHPRDQLGWPAGSPSGKYLAFAEAVCSDRWIVAGDLKLLDVHSGTVRQIDTQRIDVSYTEWRSDRALLVAGHRGFDTAVGIYDVVTGAFRETWSSREITVGGRFITVSGLNDAGDCVLAGESFVRTPEVGAITGGEYRIVRAFAEDDRSLDPIHRVEHMTWKAPDGLEIQGWLLLPEGTGPFPLVMNVHGGPVSHWRNRWLGRAGGAFLMLLRRGYAVFLPNPRGSAGCGQEFARRVVGDMGGADTYDYLSGIDTLVSRGIADPKRLGVCGGSYGGYMTCWLVTQDTRFAAAVAVVPVANKVSQHLISNIPQFIEMFLADRYDNPGGKYFQRSPIMHASKVRTPTLNICGALDRCTPPEEAMQFHNALREHGVRSVLVTYPEEGHGVRRFPAPVDYAARLVGWFEEHLSPENSSKGSKHGRS